MAARFDAPFGRVLAQETLFTIPLEYRHAVGWNFYDVTSDGERFLMARPPIGDTQGGVRLILVQNFFEVLEERVPN